LNTCKNPISTRNESSLHYTLKFQYTGTGGKTEAVAGEFVADGKKADGEYIEIQIGSFAPLEKKVKKLAKNAKVRIIHPIVVKKTIEVYNKEPSRSKKYGKFFYHRASSSKSTWWNIFDVLVYAPTLPLIKGVTIEILFVDIIEKRIKDGKGSWRRKGISIADKKLTAWHESILFKKPNDFLRFIPLKKNEEFIGTFLAKCTGINPVTARKALYVLTKIKVVKRIGKKGNSWKYVRK
jgi:hypothetical protein